MESEKRIETPLRISAATNGTTHYGYINSEGALITQIIFDIAEEFSDGLARVYVRHKGWNFIREDGSLLCDNEKWFYSASDFKDGYSTVIRESGEYNFLTEGGSLISNEWYDRIFGFENGIAVVYFKDKGWNAIDRNGTYICDRWYDDTPTSFRDGVITIYKPRAKNKCNILCTDGALLSPVWFDEARKSDGYWIVKKNKKYNYLSENGDLVSDRWFEFTQSNNYDLALINSGDRYNIINTKTKELLLGEWVTYVPKQ